MLGVIERPRINVAALIEDNAITNCALARTFGVQFIGYHSQKVNLATKNMLLVHDKVIEKMNVLMRKLSFSIQAALLRRKTFLPAKQCNTTRWSSAFKTMQWYCNVRHHLLNIDHPEVKELLLSEKENSNTVTFLKRLGNLNSVTIELQSHCTRLVD